MFDRFEEVDMSDPTFRDYTMLYEVDCREKDVEKVNKYIKESKIKSIRLGSTYFLKMNNKQFDHVRRMRGVTCGLDQKAYSA